MVNILGIPLYKFNIPTAVKDVINDITSLNTVRSNKLISATGAHGIITANEDPQFKKILSEFYFNLPDGMPGVWIGRLKGAKQMERCYGPDFFKAVIQQSADQPIKHFFCGGKEGVADKLQISCAENFQNFNVVGTYSPPFSEMTEAEFTKLGKRINNSRADIVWIGLSTPKQEKFAYKLRNYTNVHFIVTVGAAFDFYTDNVQQAQNGYNAQD